MAVSDSKSVRLYRRVADNLVQSIRDGVYRPGEKLPAERELAEAFGVSRPTVREAMIALEIFGVVEIRHGSGIYIIEADTAPEAAEAETMNDDLNVGAFELIEARILIEGEMAAVAAAAVTDADIEALDALIVRMQTGDDEACEEADHEFHEHIARLTNNGALIDTVGNMWALRKQSRLAARIMTRAQGGGRAARVNEHKLIVEALATRDPAAARAAMRHHLEMVREYLLDATETAEIESLRQNLRAKRDSLSRRTSY
jgi:DNA-binding FadR family transcriptional regulator